MDASSSTSLEPALNPVDANGIPVDVLHYRGLGKRDSVRDVAHMLYTPFVVGDDSNRAFTHIYLLCAESLTSHPHAAPDAWQGALRRWCHTSNAKLHMASRHRDHPVGRTQLVKDDSRARRQRETALDEAHARDVKRRTSSTGLKPASKRRGKLPQMWGLNQQYLNVFIARWIINNGTIQITAVCKFSESNVMAIIVCVGFAIQHGHHRRVQVLSAADKWQCEVTVPAASTYHDTCSTGGGKTGVVGTSVAFTDRNWIYRHIALLVTVSNESHDSMRQKQLICTRIHELYGIKVDAIAQFTISDTAAAARKVSKLFDESVQTDCAMHAINLCLMYGMGMREHIKTVTVVDPNTKKQSRVRRVCTEGGAFPEGASLIKKIRALNNYFNTPQRVGRLAKVQQFYGLPELTTVVDCDTRVGSTVTLFTRTIVNYTALPAYFQTCEDADNASAFEAISFKEWRLLTEMEVIVHDLADLARVEVQHSDLVASELIAMVKIASDKLNGSEFDVCNLEASRTPKTNEASFLRRQVAADALTEEARTCIPRIKAQVAGRVTASTPENVMICYWTHGQSFQWRF